MQFGLSNTTDVPHVSEHGFKRRFIYVALVPILFFLIIITRLCVLQIVKGTSYLEKSKGNFIQERPIRHLRGMIFADDGTQLVDNRASHDVYITFAMLPHTRQTLRKIGDIMGKGKNDIASWLSQIEHNDRVVLAQGLNDRLCKELWQYVENSKVRGVLVDDYQEKGNMSCRVSINTLDFPSETSVFAKLRELLGISETDMKTKIASVRKKSEGLSRFKPILFYNDIGFENFARIEAAIGLGDLPGVSVFASKQRRYVNGKFAAHSLGFINEVTVAELQKENSPFRGGDRIGRKGVEGAYDAVLRGRDGIFRTVVDAKGRQFEDSWQSDFLGTERIIPPQAGNDIYLSLDYDLQKVAEESFTGQSGSIVALDIKTGFIKVLASFPSFDPNLVVGANNSEVIRQLASDKLRPWVNKAIQEHYAPGSTYKAITAVSAVQNGLINQSTSINCPGVFTLGKQSWRCYRREGHGTIDLFNAIKSSCDVFFYKVGLELGTDRLHETAKSFGFGMKTGVELAQEASGINPSVAYYKQRLGYYTKGFIVNSAIGQGDVTVTPIQLAVAYAALLNGGKVFKPQIIKKIISPQGKVIEEKHPVIRWTINNQEQTLDLVRRAQANVLQAGGTADYLRYRTDIGDVAKWLRDENPSIGGKTGTAQVKKLAKNIKHLLAKDAPYLERDHAWIALFAPIDNPELVIVVMHEHGGLGSGAAAPFALAILKKWFEKTGRSKSFVEALHAP